MTRIYKTREGAVWVVKNCRPHYQQPDFFIGEREGDGRTVTIHAHRSTVVQEQAQPTTLPAPEVNAS